MCHGTGASKVVVVIWTNSLREIDFVARKLFSVPEPIFITQWNLLSRQFDIE